MVDIRALEAKVTRNRKAGSPEDFDLLARHYWQTARAETDYRTRQKLLKRASHYVGRGFASGIEDPDALHLYMSIVRKAALVHSFPQDERRKLAQITARWLTVTGAAEHRVVARTKGKIATETATFGLGDVGLAPAATNEPWSEEQMVEWMTTGERLFFRTGYDGTIKAELRVIDGREPVLSEKEYKRLSASTPTLVLTVPTGRIGLADFALMAEPWPDASPADAIAIEVHTGCYKACVFGFSTSRSNSVIAVVCATEKTVSNRVLAVDSLFM